MESVKVVIISEDTSIRVNLKKKLADKDIQIVGYADFKERLGSRERNTFESL